MVFAQVGIPRKRQKKKPSLLLSGSAHCYGRASRVDAGHDRPTHMHKDSDEQGGNNYNDPQTETL